MVLTQKFIDVNAISEKWDRSSANFTSENKKKKKIFNSSLQSGRNMVSQLTIAYNLIAIVSFETKCVFVYRHSAQIVFVV